MAQEQSREYNEMQRLEDLESLREQMGELSIESQDQAVAMLAKKPNNVAVSEVLQLMESYGINDLVGLNNLITEMHARFDEGETTPPLEPDPSAPPTTHWGEPGGVPRPVPPQEAKAAIEQRKTPAQRLEQPKPPAGSKATLPTSPADKKLVQS